MAISGKTPAAKQATPQAQVAQSAAQPMQRGWSFHQQNLTGSQVAAGVGGEYFTSFREKLLEIYKEVANGVQVTLIPLNRQTHQSLRFSAIAVAIQMPEEVSGMVSYHTLILENTGDKLKPRTVQVDNMPVQINLTTGDAYDEILYKLANDQVSLAFPGARVIPADAMVVPSHVTVDKKEQIEAIAINAAMACVSVIEANSPNRIELNLAQMDRDCRFEINVAFGDHQVYDVTGAPQRSSVLIDYKSIQKTADNIRNQESVNTPGSEAEICKLSGFLNAVWAPTDFHSGFGFPGYPQQPQMMQQPTQKFVTELVITSVQSPFATNLSAVLMAVTSGLVLADNNNWLQGWVPRNSRALDSGRLDLTDIGALNITANITNETANGGIFGSPMSMASMGGDLSKISQYLVALFQPGCLISMDVPECGPETWYLSVFAAAAAGDTDAQNSIIQAADELFDGHFSKYFQFGDEMFSNQIRVPMGHYMADGKVQDIRNIDYTAIANIFKNNPTVIHEYANSFLPRSGFSAQRLLAIREGIIRDALNQNCDITGYAGRFSFSDKFLKALSSANAEIGLPTRVVTPMNADQMRIGTPAPDFIGRALTSGTRSFNNSFGIGAPRQINTYMGRAFRRG